MFINHKFLNHKILKKGFCLQISASTDPDDANSNGMSKASASDVSIFLSIGKPIFLNGANSLPGNSSD